MREETKIVFFLIILAATHLIYYGTIIADENDFSSEISFDKSLDKPIVPKISAPPLVWSNPSSGEVMSCDISSDNNYIVSADGSNLRFYIRSSSSPQWIYDGPGMEGIEIVSISSDGFYIASKGSMAIFLHQRTSSAPLWNYTDQTYILEDVKISDDGNSIIVGARGPEARLFDNTGVSIQNYSLGSDVVSMAISSNGFYIAIGTKSHGVYLFNRTSDVFMWRYPLSSWVRCVDISSDGKYIAAGGYDNGYNNLYLFNNSKNNPKTPIWLFREVGNVFSVDITPDGKYIVSSSHNRVYLHQNTSSTPIWWYTNGRNLVYFDNVKVSDDGNYILTGEDDISYPGSGEKVYLFHRSQNISLWEYSVPTSVASLVISPDGEYCVAGTSFSSANTYLFRKYHPPLSPSLTSNAETPIDKDGRFDLLWDLSSTTNSYTVYAYDKPITKINSSLTIHGGITEPYYNVTRLLSGRYFYIVVAFNGTGYALSNCIEIIVSIPPGHFTLDSNADTPEKDGNFNLTWSTSLGADNYSIYSHHDYIHEIKNNGTLEDEGIEELYFEILGLLSGDYYYMVIAYNQTGNVSSNCLQVSVRIPPKDFNMFTDAIDPETDGIFNLTWTNSVGADNYSVYRSNDPILSLDECIEVKNNITILNYTVVWMTTDTLYFVIVSYNETGFTLSNYIQINISISSYPSFPQNGGGNGGDSSDNDEDYAIPFENNYMLIVLISTILLLVLKKRKIVIRGE